MKTSVHPKYNFINYTSIKLEKKIKEIYNKEMEDITPNFLRPMKLE